MNSIAVYRTKKGVNTKGGKEMMKKKLVAVGLAATLALGAVPALAFAAGGATDPTSLDSSNSASTNVKVATVVGQIDATIPLNMVISAPMTGGALTGAPDNYKIVNNSIFDIKVSTAAVTVETTDWGATLKTDPIAANTEPTGAGAAGDIQLEMTPGSETAAKWNMSSPFADAGTKWVASGKAGSTSGELLLNVSGSVSKLKKSFDAATPSKVVTVKYTISAK